MLSRSLYLLALAAIPSTAQEFDPAAELPSCLVIPYQDEVTYFQPSDASCAAETVNNTQAAIEALAVKYAPVVYFPPLDVFTMADPMMTFQGTGKIVSGGTTQDTLDLSTLADLSSADQYIAHDLTDEYKAGAGFDAEGLSQAPVYFSHKDMGDNVWLFNYYYFFPYVGMLTMAYASDAPYSQFQVAPFGVHEGDWESISVMVCAGSDTTDPPAPLAVHYYGLAQSSITDCTKGECSFYPGTTTHPVAFSALNHHAMYPFPSLRTFFGKVDLESFQLGNLLVVDVQNYEDADGNTRMFMPSADNVKMINETMDVWKFGGRWGESVDESIEPDLNLVCTNEDATAYDTCPDNQVVLSILGLFGTITPATVGDFLDARLVPLVFNRALGDFGPMSWPNYGAWPAPELAPIWDTIDGDTVDDAQYCADVGVAGAAGSGGGAVTPSPTPAPPRRRSTSGASVLRVGFAIFAAAVTFALAQ